MPLGDVVDNKHEYQCMNNQMKNELNVLRLAEHAIPAIAMYNIVEVDSPLTPKPTNEQFFKLEGNKNAPINVSSEPKAMQANLKESEPVTLNKEQTPSAPQNIDVIASSTSLEAGKIDQQPKIVEQKNVVHVVEPENVNKSIEVQKIENTTESADISKPQQVKPIQHLLPVVNTNNDMPSSDLSDTDTEKPEKIFNESGVDETSRDEHDERDEVSEIDNYLSSCGEDSLEMMYYTIRKNEIIMDKKNEIIMDKLKKADSEMKADDEKISFPDKITDDLEIAVREVSGKNSKICSIASINSSDEVVLKQLSTDSDGGLQLHVIADSEIDSSSEPKLCTAAESTDDEYVNSNYDSMHPEKCLSNENVSMCRLAMIHDDGKTDDDEENEIDNFPENSLEEDITRTIERKILASSLSEPDSDYYELPATNTNRLTKDDFNVSTAFEHMLRNDSTTTESDSTIESAATKIQAGARGFLTRRRLRKSSAGTSVSLEKHSSIGNAAIDKSLDDLAEQHELKNSSESSPETFSDQRPQLNTDLTMEIGSFDDAPPSEILGITEVKLEQRKEENLENITQIIVSEAVQSEDTKESDDSTSTMQRRMTLQRGDAVQRNSTPDDVDQSINDKKKTNENPTEILSNEPIATSNENNNTNESKIVEKLPQNKKHANSA